MKTIARLTAIMAIIISPGLLQAQFVVVNYMKVKPANMDKYIAFESNWKKVHEARQMAGNMVQWFLYSKEFGGADEPYQFITVNVFKSMADYFAEDWNAINKWLPDMSQEKLDELNARTEEIRTIGSTQCFYLDAKTNARPMKPSAFMVVDFMRSAPGKTADYQKAEKEIFMPMHAEMVNQKLKDGWDLWAKVFGSNTDFDFVTANYYSSMDQWGKGDAEAIFKKAHPGKNMEIAWKAIDTRTSTATEVWRLIDYLPAVGK